MDTTVILFISCTLKSVWIVFYGPVLANFLYALVHLNRYIVANELLEGFGRPRASFSPNFTCDAFWGVFWCLWRRLVEDAI